MIKPRISYQKFSKNKGGIVLVDKYHTRIEIAYKLIKHFNKEYDKIIWIGSCNTLKNQDYHFMIKTIFRKLYDEIIFFSYEEFSFHDDDYLSLYHLSNNQRIFCIIDAALNLRKTTSIKTKRLLLLRNNFVYRLLLSDDLFCCSVHDAYTQLQVISPHNLSLTEAQFKQLYMPFYTDKFNISKRWSRLKHEKRLVKWLKKYIIYYDCDKSVKNIEYAFYFNLSEMEKEAYFQEKQNFLNKRAYYLYLPVVQQFQYLYTICEQKIKILQKVLKNIRYRKEKTIIYVKYMGEIIFLRESGVLQDYKYVVVTGSRNKKRAVRLFLSEADIMICTYKVNIPTTFLHDCKNVIYFSQTFDYLDKKYIFSKIRDNTVVRVFDFWVNTTLENMIEDNLRRKINTFNNLRKFISEV